MGRIYFDVHEVEGRFRVVNLQTFAIVAEKASEAEAVAIADRLEKEKTESQMGLF